MKADDFENLSEAIDAVPEGGKLKLAADTAIDEELTISKSMKIIGNGAQINKLVTVNDADVELDNVVLVAPGEDASSKTPIVKASGTAPFTMKNCKVKGAARTAVNIMTSGDIDIEGCTFDAGDQSIYNMIEFSISNARDIENVVIKGNTFKGALKNNGICLYNLAEGATVDISENKFVDINVDNNPVRLSNPKNVSATFKFENNTYSFSSDVPNAQGYTAFMLLQDYSKSGAPIQDFSKFDIHFKNLKRGEKVLTEKGTGIDQVYYVYMDQKGILPDGENDPVVTFE